MLHTHVFSQSRNPFVERAVEYCVAAASAKFVDKDNKNALHKLLLQGMVSFLLIPRLHLADQIAYISY